MSLDTDHHTANSLINDSKTAKKPLYPIQSWDRLLYTCTLILSNKVISVEGVCHMKS